MNNLVGYSLAKSLYNALPCPLRRILVSTLTKAKLLLDSDFRAKNRWLTDHYQLFGQQQRENIFLASARFCHINRPISGYYFEFGSHGANTMRLAWKHFQYLFDWSFIAFDSFEGLPEVTGIDRIEIFKKGRLVTAENEFVRLVRGAGMPLNRLRTVKGFYKESLTPALRDELLPCKAAVIYVDCDLYASTVPVLEFVKDFLQIGTIIIFDDWNCYHADPCKGERLAWAEFRARNPHLMFEDFYVTNEAKAFVFVGNSQLAQATSAL
jgi:O-methyltransferase